MSCVGMSQESQLPQQNKKKKSLKASLMIQTLGAYYSLLMTGRRKHYLTVSTSETKKNVIEPQNLSRFYFLLAPIAPQHVVLYAHKLHFHS